MYFWLVCFLVVKFREFLLLLLLAVYNAVLVLRQEGSC